MSTTDRQTRWVAVDDADLSSITYTGDWDVTYEQFDGVLNPFGPPHMGSQHATRTSGGFSFSFQGSQVRIYGTSDQTNTTTLQDPLWECSVDSVNYGNEPGYKDGPINQWTLCKADLSSDGQHTLSVVADVSRGTFFFDSIMYRPSYELWDSLHPTVYIHHSDTALKFSAGGWVSHEDNHARLTSQKGAKLKLAFNGTKATWIGRIPPGYSLEDSTATYSIDGQKPVEFTIMGLPRNNDEGLFYHPLFETPKLSLGEHHIEVVHQGPGAPLALEYFLVEDSDIVQPQGLILEFNDSDSSYNYPSGSQGNNTKKPPLGAIVGGAVAGVVVVAALAILVLFYLKRRKTKSSQADMLPIVVHSPAQSTANIPLPPDTPQPTTQVSNSYPTGVLPSPDSPSFSPTYAAGASTSIMSVTPAAGYHHPPSARYSSTGHPPSSSHYPPHTPAQPTGLNPSTHLAPQSTGTSVFDDPPEYQESEGGGSSYPSDAKRPISSDGPSSSRPVVLSPPEDRSLPYDVSLLGIKKASS